MYALDLDVPAANPGGDLDVFGRLVEHVLTWVNYGRTVQVAPHELRQPGEVELPPSRAASRQGGPAGEG